MCERIVHTNPGTIVELTHSSDSHFHQLFIAYAISIKGFAMGCRPLIAINSYHMSGPYGGALFSTTIYDANDHMFLLALCVLSSKNYEDWHGFFQNPKKIIGEKEVVIISDRHQAVLRSIPEIFGVENHAYCYWHLKNFITFLNRHNTRGNKGKQNALEWLDSVAYVKREEDYNAHISELHKYNDALATWVKENGLEHWTMSKFPKQR